MSEDWMFQFHSLPELICLLSHVWSGRKCFAMHACHACFHAWYMIYLSFSPKQIDICLLSGSSKKLNAGNLCSPCLPPVWTCARDTHGLKHTPLLDHAHALLAVSSPPSNFPHLPDDINRTDWAYHWLSFNDSFRWGSGGTFFFKEKLRHGTG